MKYFAEDIQREQLCEASPTSNFKKNGYEQCPYEHTLYIKKSGEDAMFIALYVDDLILMGNNAELIEGFKEDMMKEFEMTDLGLMKYFLSLEVAQGENDIFVSHEMYAEEVLKKFKMTSWNPISTNMEPDTKLSKYADGD